MVAVFLLSEDNPELAGWFLRVCRKENAARVTQFTEAVAGVSYWSAMARETHQTMLDPQRDIATDYALIATGVVAALIALAFLILI